MPAIERPPMHLEATRGSPLVIELESAPGAGVVWLLPAAPEGCQLSEADSVPGDTGIGGPARQRFVLTCTAPGRRQLRFEFKRPWETEVRALQPVDVDVR
ncbi:protease inhibitor I42 family protein [Variovorax rhizosphaerae]|uniref:Protease inhibitor I42 family protein n=1 Tax=Variovorax rhizosphaerae TaxID=1836200 RepID=A0ABU8WMA3_9BURK